MDNRTSALTLFLIGFVCAFVGAVGLWATQSTDELTRRLATAVASLVAGIPIIIGFLYLSAGFVACLPSLVRAYDWLQARRHPSPVPVAEQPKAASIEIHTPEQKAAWRGYWSQVLGYAAVEGGVAFRRVGALFGNDSEKWKECFAIPMVGQGWFTAVEQGVTTEALKPIPEILRELAKGVTPPPPNTRSWPPELYQQSTVPTPETPAKKRGNSRATVTNTGAQADSTVYASEREGMGR